MSSRLLKKYEKIPGGLRIEITGIQYYCSTALESAVRTADTILVMNAGRIVEQGTHAQLLAKKGFYYDLYNSQFS